jgi:hypothetical protein
VCVSDDDVWTETSGLCECMMMMCEYDDTCGRKVAVTAVTAPTPTTRETCPKRQCMGERLMMTTGRLALLQMIAALASSAASSSDAQPFTLAPSNADSAAVTSNDANASTQTPAPIIFHRMVPDGGQEKWSGYIRSWDRLLNQTTEDGQPRWQVKEHRDSDFRAILELAVPHLVDRIMAFHHPVEINDVSRYAALYHYGGVYADLDVELLSPEVFAQAARTADVIFPHEKTRLMGQSIMISPQPRNPFWLKLIEYITEQ